MAPYKDLSLLWMLRRTTTAPGATPAERIAASLRIAAIEAGTDHWRDWIVENDQDADFERASGLALCQVCGRILYDHAYIPGALDYRGHPYLFRDCTGRGWKL